MHVCVYVHAVCVFICTNTNTWMLLVQHLSTHKHNNKHIRGCCLYNMESTDVLDPFLYCVLELPGCCIRHLLVLISLSLL